ncbi:MAG: hypothetical protein RL223_4372 [Pseudomonadota bacterium]
MTPELSPLRPPAAARQPSATLQSLIGALHLRPGATPAPHGAAALDAEGPIHGGRPALASRLAAGRPADDWPALVGRLHNLCSGAHTLAATLALQAARAGIHRRRPDDVNGLDAMGSMDGTDDGARPAGHAIVRLPAGPQAVDPRRHVWRPDALARQHLTWHTAREQALRLAHDGPTRLGGGPAAAELTRSLHGSPWLHPLAEGADVGSCQARRAEAAAWVDAHWCGGRSADWLAAWDDGGGPALAAQLSCADTPLTRWLAPLWPVLSRLATPHRPLDLLDHGRLAFERLGRDLATPGWTRRPQWQQTVPDTGPWSRHHAPRRHRMAEAGSRLLARLVDLLQLLQADIHLGDAPSAPPVVHTGANSGHEDPIGSAPAAFGAARLACGAVQLDDGAGLAWVETARGLLLHRLRLAAGSGGRHLAEAQVLAPTEWNFHPRGTLAQALCELPASAEGARGAQGLAFAYDPCMPCTIDPAAGTPTADPTSEEIRHA